MVEAIQAHVQLSPERKTLPLRARDVSESLFGAERLGLLQLCPRLIV